MKEPKLINVDIGNLVPYERNPNVHGKAQVEQIAESIKRFGWTVPILCDEDNNIVAGHGRYLAAKKLKMKTVPVLVREFSDEERRAYIIADNLLAEGSHWDKNLLGLELASLDGFDLGFLDIASLNLDLPVDVDDTTETEVDRNDREGGESSKADPIGYVVMATLDKASFARWKALKDGLSDKEFIMQIIEEGAHD